MENEQVNVGDFVSWIGPRGGIGHGTVISFTYSPRYGKKSSKTPVQQARIRRIKGGWTIVPLIRLKKIDENSLQQTRLR